MAERLQGDQAIAMRDCDGGGGEGALPGRLVQEGEGAGKDFVLMVEGWDGSRRVIQGVWTFWGIVA